VTTRDGRRLHVERAGTGSPIVVFESGMGASRSSWGAVAPAVAAHTTAVVYDRSGLGRSPRDPRRRDLQRLAGDLVDVLEHAGPGPFVLVGHSWGGPIVRVAAGRVPDRIAGLVLVDQTDEGCELFFSQANERQTRWMPRVLPLLGHLGIVRLAVRRLARDLPEPWASSMRLEDGTPAALRVQAAELESSIDDLRRLRDDPPSMPDVPVTVISGIRTNILERSRRGELVAAHRARAEALPHGRHVEATASSHYVPFTDAELTVREIVRIVELERGPEAGS
jgi:pimeloyl-ACP methyl ester carboxylesterase